MTSNRKLPIGIQDFEKLRTGGNIYVDKTAYIRQLLGSDAPYFLGRPRRFGKSLFLSTLKAYFQGKKELFAGLSISESEKEWEEYPVFHLDMSVEAYTDVASLHSAMNTNLAPLESKWGKVSTEETPSARFMGVIRRAYEQSGRKVVVLVDEYDKPLIGMMEANTAAGDAIRIALKGFYGVLKSADAYLRFVFFTGVTKFSKVSIFSDINQLKDISMSRQYAGICGISEAELIRDFQPELEAMAAEKGITREEVSGEMKKRYDGYHFAPQSEDIYNPFSVLNTLSDKTFRYYWFQTGTPTFLVDMLKRMEYDIPKLEGEVKMQGEAVMDYRMGGGDPVPILYQSGYLTIKKYDELLNEYTLGFPNEEVRYGFYGELLMVYMPGKRVTGEFSVTRFVSDLWSHDTESFMRRLKAFFAGVPYELNNRTEKHFQTIFYIFFKLTGQYVEVEYRTATGRIDAVVITVDTVYAFEFKLSERATAEEALKQIDEKGYLIPFTARGKRLVKTGVSFSLEERGVSRWIVEE